MSDPKLIEAAIREAANRAHNYCCEQEGVRFLSSVEIDRIVGQVFSNYRLAAKRAEKQQTDIDTRKNAVIDAATAAALFAKQIEQTVTIPAKDWFRLECAIASYKVAAKRAERKEVKPSEKTVLSPKE